MASVAVYNHNYGIFEHWDFQTTFRINNKLCRFPSASIKEVFVGGNVSITKAIEQEKMLQCFIDVGEQQHNHFKIAGDISLVWVPEEEVCLIGLIWVEPEFRGYGLATSLLTEVTRFADELNIVLKLHAVPFVDSGEKPTSEDISKSQAYYRRFGFRSISATDGKGFNSIMERLPSKRN